MILGKALILKGLAGVTALSGAVAVGVIGDKEGWWRSKNSPKSPANEVKEETAESLIENAGLSCTFTSNDCEITTLGSSKKINVKYDDDTKKDDINSISVSDSAKIKVQKNVSEGDYNKNLKLTIEGGNITLTGGSGSETISKLEEFETYEIKKDDTNQKYYLTRKDKAGKKIKELLGLPSDCNLPEESSSSGTTCNIDTSKIGTIKFDGENSTTSITGTAILTITKLTTSDPEFPFDYKFGFKASSSESTILTINSKAITLKQNEDTEFRIKKDTSGNSLTLAQVWTLETLAKKVNLICTNNECTQISGQTTNIKKDSDLDGKTLPNSGSGKIKVYTTETTGYDKDFRFVIEGGDITITNGDSNKLEEFETYEIKKESDKWYFYRKDKAEKGIKKALGLDGIENCNLPEGTTTQECCNLDAGKLKKINFDGKSTSSDPSISESGTAKLKISKTTSNTSSDFPLGFKFVLESEKEITIPLSSGSSSMSLKKNTNTEFKIKATTPSNATARTLALEKAWDINKLAEKVGLSDCDTSSKECTLKDNSINVNNGGDSNKIDGAKVKDGGGNSKKLKYQEDQEGYNQGFKFTLDGNTSITLTKEGNGSTTLNIENSDASYEIKQDSNDNKWYLTKYTAVAS